jgi:hypothetical protein
MLYQGFNVLRFQGMVVHAPVSQFVQLIGNQGELPLPLCLGAVTPFPVVPAQLFELVVQASHGVSSLFRLVFPTTLPPWLAGLTHKI